jgi:biotin carboxyl carrier protein
MAEIRAEITANVAGGRGGGPDGRRGRRDLASRVDEDGDSVITETPGVVRELYVAPEQTVQEGDLIALIDES